MDEVYVVVVESPGVPTAAEAVFRSPKGADKYELQLVKEWCRDHPGDDATEVEQLLAVGEIEEGLTTWRAVQDNLGAQGRGTFITIDKLPVQP